MSTHADRANQIIEELDDQPLRAEVLILLAQAHATMALVEAVDNWRPPGDDEEQRTIPFEFTKEGQTW